MDVTQIGIINTPFTESSGMPVQPSASNGVEGTVEVFPEFAEGLADLEGFDRIWLLFWFDRSCETKLTVIPYKDDHAHGLFATRAPCRPNPVGISSVRLVRIEGTTLHVADVDVLNGTPLIDIKPYVPEFDIYPNCRAGWLDRSLDISTADNRFYSNTQKDKK